MSEYDLVAELYMEKIRKAVAAEREACARVAENLFAGGNEIHTGRRIAAAIRARKD